MGRTTGRSLQATSCIGQATVWIHPKMPANRQSESDMKLVRLIVMAALTATTTVYSTHTGALAQATPAVTYPTRSGPRTVEQLQSELGAGGYAGPWDPTLMVAAYDRAGLPTIDPYPNDTTWSRSATNPSCGRDTWWAGGNEDQDDSHVSCAAIGPHFVTERRYAEAIDLLWQWPNGKRLLQQADSSGVKVMTLSYDQQTAFATYSPQRKLIAFKSRFTAVPTWMTADVIAHELSHAADDAHGVNQAPTPAACLAGETAATQTQQRFLVWLTRTLEPAGLPNVAAVSARLSAEQTELAQSLYDIGFSTDIPALVGRAYDETC